MAYICLYDCGILGDRENHLRKQDIDWHRAVHISAQGGYGDNPWVDFDSVGSYQDADWQIAYIDFMGRKDDGYD